MTTVDSGLLVNQFLASSDDTKEVYQQYSTKLAGNVEQDQLSLLGFIQLLGDKLTAEDDLMRGKAIFCLSETLAALDKLKLTKQDINVLLEFYLAKVDDRHSMMYVLQGLNNIILFKNFNPKINDNLVTLLNKIIEYDATRHLAKVRYEAFNIVNSLFEGYKDIIVGNDKYSELFVQSFINISSGEKDPRNLLLSFKLNQKINQTFQFNFELDVHKNFINDLFDNCFCYFPISFKPPKNDPYKISSDELKLQLRNTLTSQPLFAKDLFNNLFEKLTSTNPVVRNDVLLTLLQAIKQFSPDTLIEYWEYLWNGLKFEILHFENLSLFDPFDNSFIPNTLFDIPDEDENKPIYLTLQILNDFSIKLQDQPVYFDFITKDLHENLSINNKFFKQAVILLSSIGSTSITSFNFINRLLFRSEVFGKFLNTGESQHHDDDDEMEKDMTLTISKQRDLIDNFGYIFTSYQILANNVHDHDEHFFSNNELANIKDHLIVFMGQLLQSSSTIEKTLKCKIIKQYIKLIELKHYLTFEEKRLVIGILNDMFVEILISDDKFLRDVIVQEILQGFNKLLTNYNEEINQLIIENFIPNLLDGIYPESEKLDDILKVLEKVVVNYQLLEMISIRLVNKLTKSEVFNYKLLGLIKQLILANQSRNQFLMNSWFKNFLPNLFKHITQDIGNIQIIASLTGIIVKYNDKSNQQQVFDKLLNIFYFGHGDMNLKGYTIIDDSDLAIIIINQTFANIDKSVKLNLDKQELTKKLIEKIKPMDDQIMRINYLQHLSLVINKFLDNSDNEFIETEMNQVKNPEQLKLFEIYIWILKSLIIKLNPIGVNEFKQSLTLLDSKAKVVYLKSFKILIKTMDIYSPGRVLQKGQKLVSQVNNLNVRLLYKQQIFNLTIDRVLQNQDNLIYLNLLSILLNNVDENIVRLRIKEIIPLVMKSLTIPSLLKTSLSTLLIIIDTTDLLQYLPFLMKRTLELASTKNGDEIRNLSLRCLYGLLQVTDKQEILNYKRDILAKTVVCLDDSKRSNRKLTCDIRQLLYEVR